MRQGRRRNGRIVCRRSGSGICANQGAADVSSGHGDERRRRCRQSRTIRRGARIGFRRAPMMGCDIGKQNRRPRQAENHRKTASSQRGLSANPHWPTRKVDSSAYLVHRWNSPGACRPSWRSLMPLVPPIRRPELVTAAAPQGPLRGRPEYSIKEGRCRNRTSQGLVLAGLLPFSDRNHGLCSQPY